jgi:DNA polymerase epsilon subunit 1
MPLALHALLQLGCVCKVDSKARNRTVKEGWSLNDLHMKTTTECSYLMEDLQYIFLYHSLVFCFTISENDFE